MRSDHHAQIVALKERVQVVSSKIDNVILLLRVSLVVVLEAVFFFCLMRVAPE
jgi:hypothetical protein